MFFLELFSALMVLLIILFLATQIFIPFIRGVPLWPSFKNDHELKDAIHDREQQSASEIINKVKNESK